MVNPRFASLSALCAVLLAAAACGCEQRGQAPDSRRDGAAANHNAAPRAVETAPPAQSEAPTASSSNGSSAMPIAPGRFAAKELFALARMHSSGAVPDESRESLPIPIRTREGLRVQFIFFAAVPRPNQQLLGVPQYLATLDPKTGALELLRKVTPADFGQSHDRAQPIGPFSLPPGVTLEEFTRDTERLLQVYDELLPAFGEGRASGTVDAKLRAEFVKLFARVYEAPLAAYYKSAGGEFFTWVGVTFP
ncbi:MAG: hypothetical protein IPM64_16465 [Phycisphaerales bacterium]|nr:hypothetical protein [Phycisphaerales bacterium]